MSVNVYMNLQVSVVVVVVVVVVVRGLYLNLAVLL